MLHEPLCKAFLSAIFIPIASGIGWLVAQTGATEAGVLIEKFGLMGGAIAIIGWLIAERKANERKALAQEAKVEAHEEKVAQQLAEERALYRQDLKNERDLYRQDLRELIEAIKHTKCGFPSDGFKEFSRHADRLDREESDKD